MAWHVMTWHVFHGIDEALGHGCLPPPPVGFAPSKPVRRGPGFKGVGFAGGGPKTTSELSTVPSSKVAFSLAEVQLPFPAGSPRWRGTMSPSNMASSHTPSICWAPDSDCHQTHRDAQPWHPRQSLSPVSVSFRLRALGTGCMVGAGLGELIIISSVCPPLRIPPP